MTDENAHSTGGTEWEFQEGETLVKEEMSEQTMPGLEGIETEKTEYTVKYRLTNPDEGRRFYYLEWEVETPGGPRVENQLSDADLVRLHYRSVDTETER